MPSHDPVNPPYLVEGYIVHLVLAILVVWFGVCVVRTLVVRWPRARTMWFAWFGALVAGWLVVSVCILTARTAGDRIRCAGMLRQIWLAMDNYAHQYGSYPPAYTVDKHGNRLHSWRVFVRRFMESQPIYRLPFDEPWNSPYNQERFGFEPLAPCYWCTSDKDNQTETNYVMVVGPKTISNGPGCIRPEDITDGKANTICVVEVVGSGIAWQEPRDLVFDEMSFEINDPDRPSIGSRHYRIAHVVFFDGTVREVPEGTDPELIKGMLTINGGEDVSEFFKPPERPR